jgi:hypothetical protein
LHGLEEYLHFGVIGEFGGSPDAWGVLVGDGLRLFG